MQLRSIPALAGAQPGFVHSILCHQVLMLHKLPLPAGASAKGTAEQHSSTPGWEPLQAALNSCMQCTTFFFFNVQDWKKTADDAVSIGICN